MATSSHGASPTALGERTLPHQQFDSRIIRPVLRLALAARVSTPARCGVPCSFSGSRLQQHDQTKEVIDSRSKRRAYRYTHRMVERVGGDEASVATLGRRIRDRALIGTRILLPSLIPRRTHLYGVGMAKSGTHSLAGLFESYRVKHEPEFERLLDLLVKRAEGTCDDRDLMKYLRSKDRRLYLEVDASSLNAAVLPLLLNLHDRALFVLTVREPQMWLQSLIDHQLWRPQCSLSCQRWRQMRFGRYPHCRQDQVLAEYGLFSIDGYLHEWRRHHDEILATIPPGRLMVVPTVSLADKADLIAAFGGVPRETLRTEAAHRFKALFRSHMLTRLDETYLSDRIQSICGQTAERLKIEGG